MEALTFWVRPLEHACVLGAGPPVRKNIGCVRSLLVASKRVSSRRPSKGRVGRLNP